MFNNCFSKIAPFMRICGKSIVERGRPHMTIRRMRIACWKSKATNTHSECVILIANAPQCYVIRTFTVLLWRASDQGS